MSVFTFPRQNVTYRIRNIDYMEYLEQRSEDRMVVMRPEKEHASQQVSIQHGLYIDIMELSADTFV